MMTTYAPRDLPDGFYVYDHTEDRFHGPVPTVEALYLALDGFPETAVGYDAADLRRAYRRRKAVNVWQLPGLPA